MIVPRAHNGLGFRATTYIDEQMGTGQEVMQIRSQITSRLTVMNL